MDSQSVKKMIEEDEVIHSGVGGCSMMGQQVAGGEAAAAARAARRAREFASSNDKAALWRAVTAAIAAQGHGQQARMAGGVGVWDLPSFAELAPRGRGEPHTEGVGGA
jgi:hypothetical protein